MLEMLMWKLKKDKCKIIMKKYIYHIFLWNFYCLKTKNARLDTFDMFDAIE